MIDWNDEPLPMTALKAGLFIVGAVCWGGVIILWVVGRTS